MSISRDEFSDKDSLAHLIDGEAKELERFMPEKAAREYRDTKLKAVSLLATPRSLVRAFIAATGLSGVAGVCAAGVAIKLGLGTEFGAALFKIGTASAMLSPIFGLANVAVADDQNQDRRVALLEEIIRSTRRTERLRKGIFSHPN